MKIVESIMTKNPCYTAGQKITVKGLMLHSVGCPQPCAKVFVNLWNKNSYSYACVHAFIDANDGTILQTLPWNHRAWHGDGSSNNTHIGVEMCEPNCIKYTTGASFTCSNLSKARAMAERTYNSAVELFAHLCKEYKLDPMADGVIVSHSEGYRKGIASNHADPEHLWKGLGMSYTMDTFRKAVKSAMDGTAYVPSVKEWQQAAIADGFKFPIYGADGKWGNECASVAKKAIVKKRWYYTNKNLTRIVQRVVGVTADGLCGNATRNAIIAYQKKHGLVADGEVGINTWKKILGVRT
jgi:hypothetical protein